MSQPEVEQKRARYWPGAKAAFTAVVVKILLLMFAGHSYHVTQDKKLGNWQDFLALLTRWDATSYVFISQHGYVTEGPERFYLAYFPLYPLLIAAGALIFRDHLLSAFIISAIASIVLAVVFRKLVRLDYSERISQAAVLFMFIFPTAFFLHVPYTESLFLALVVIAFWAARTRKWILAGVIGMFAASTRINGMVLFPALFLEAYHQYRAERQVNYRWLSVMLIPLGFISYLTVNYVVSGSPITFLAYQRENWGKALTLPFSAFKGAFEAYLYRNPSEGHMVGYEELLFAAIGFVAIVLGWRSLRNSYRLWMVINWLLFVCTSFILSVPRYTLTMFPIFILMAAVARRSQPLNVLFIVWSLLYLGLFLSRYVTNNWAF